MLLVVHWLEEVEEGLGRLWEARRVPWEYLADVLQALALGVVGFWTELHHLPSRLILVVAVVL